MRRRVVRVDLSGRDLEKARQDAERQDWLLIGCVEIMKFAEFLQEVGAFSLLLDGCTC